MEFEEKIPNFLIDMLKEQYGDTITKTILNGYKVKRKITFRVNTLKSNIILIKDELDKKGIQYEKVKFYKDALIIKNANKKEIENLDIYKNGEIYLQSLSSMLPPIVLNPKHNENILDMCAAPGGKITQIASMCNNDIHITACEINHIRKERLKYNLEKQGVTCAYIMRK